MNCFWAYKGVGDIESCVAKVVLMSIKPRFAEAILSGCKHCEFRRAPFSQPVSHIIIYSTSPIQKIVGVVEVTGVEQSDLATIKERFLIDGHISECEFDEYFKGKVQGTAILLGSRFRLEEPVDINALWIDVSSPQSYCYLQPERVSSVTNMLPLLSDYKPTA